MINSQELAVVLTGPYHGRLWIQKKELQGVPALKPGTLVDILSREGEYVTRGFLNRRTRISVRVLPNFLQTESLEDYFKRTLEKAIRLRLKDLELEKITDSFRLVHAEGDGLSGLIVDKLADWLVVQFFSVGMFKTREVIFKVLKAHFPASNLYFFAEKRVQKQESFDCFERKSPPSFWIRENGLHFEIDLSLKHKTGFYLDQRENRKKLTSFTKGKKVLDLFSFSGGFSLYAKGPGQAASVLAVEKDLAAIELLKRNASKNQLTVETQEGNLFDDGTWDNFSKDYSVIILDPPKQTRDASGIFDALRRYQYLNTQAMKLFHKEGLLVTCSCSGLIKESDFEKMLQRSAGLAGKAIKFLEITTQGSDHPCSVNFLESKYLKVFWVWVSP